MNAQTDLPKIIISTNDCISSAHGTGTVLLRQLSAYPEEKLFNVYMKEYGVPALKNSIKVYPKPFQETTFKENLFFAARSIKRTLYGQPDAKVGRRIEAVVTQIRKKPFEPHLIYSNASSEADIFILERLVESFNCNAILYFQDIISDNESDLIKRLENLSSNVKKIWALTPEIAAEIEKTVRRKVDVISNQHSHIPKEYKKEYRPFSSDFKVVMIGNIWHPNVLNKLSVMWGRIRTAIAGLKPIQWYAHPESVRRVEKYGITLLPQIEYAGFFQGDDYLKNLLSADIALSPLNEEKYAVDAVAKYSLPSRMTELAALGIPMFFAASGDSATANYLRRTGIGVSQSMADENLFCQSMEGFIMESGQREKVGKTARAFAEKELNIEIFQKKLYEIFRETAREK